MNVIDLFAGPGGWDVAARRLGIDPLGFELDAAAIQTRNAAGLRTIVDRDGGLDVATLYPRAYGPVDGLIASPPCQAFSAAGKGKGRADRDIIELCANDLADGFDSREALLGCLLDHRSLLVVEPLRWALDLRPRWLAFEQVPPVLPLWELFAPLLEEVGYSTWTGCLQAEMFGVPQTRKRAFLLARLNGPIAAPVPTHSRYYPRDPRRLDPGVLPWVSMADALGWGMTRRPSMTVAGGGASTGGAEPFAKSAREGMRREEDRGAWTHYRSTTMPNSALRSIHTPAPTIAFGHDAASARWLLTRQVGAQARSSDAPSPTVLAAGMAKGVQVWTDRAGPYVQFDDRVSERVTVEEAAVLQSFPADYPWKGKKGKQFEQVGNAVPPGLALAVLEAATGVVALPEELAA